MGTWKRVQASIMCAPYFDADLDYPVLLHIAVRAWEHACWTTWSDP